MTNWKDRKENNILVTNKNGNKIKTAKLNFKNRFMTKCTVPNQLVKMEQQVLYNFLTDLSKNGMDSAEFFWVIFSVA